MRELLAAGRRGVREVWLAEGRDPSPVLEEIVDLAGGAGVRVRFADAERVAAEAGIDGAQGVLAIAEPVPTVELDALAGGNDVFLVVLDGVTDPRNLGAVLRTAVGAGATGAIVARHRAALLTPAAVKAAAGAVEHLPIALVAGIPAALEQLRRHGVWTVGLDAGGDTTVRDLAVADASLALVLGAEGRGLARLTKERCDLLARIPLRGAIESLNVSAAAAVACFEIAARRGLG